jgi:hypothetical protein
VPLGSSEVANEQGYTLTNPTFYNPNQPVTTFPANTTEAAPTGYSLDPHFHAANDMQAAVGLDRQLAKVMTGNVTYLYSRGEHMYLTNNVSAIGSFPGANAQAGAYPTEPIAEPTQNDMQYQSGGVYRQSHVIVSVTARYPRFSLFSFYTYSSARSDTSGVRIRLRLQAVLALTMGARASTYTIGFCCWVISRRRGSCRLHHLSRSTRGRRITSRRVRT